MLSEPSYLPARMVAPTIVQHLAQHRAVAEEQGFGRLSDLPSIPLLEAIIDATFWASLRKEEGQAPRISLALLRPEQAGQPLVFGHRRRLTPQHLIKLAPAVVQPGIHLGVWYDEDELYVWGTATGIPPLCFVLEVVEPGLLVAKHRRADGFGKFVNVAVLRGDQIKVVDEANAGLADCPALLATLPSLPLPTATNAADNVLVELAAAMRTHGRGGLLLVVPPGSQAWRESIVQPLSYPVVPAFGGIARLLRQPPAERAATWQPALLQAIGTVGGFTAVDGATVVTQNYEVLAFGAKVTRAATSIPVEEMVLTEPVLDSEVLTLHPAQNGGTRHLAAAQFVFDQRDCVAMVASQDGYFTVFAWSIELQTVHAHRIDVLLM
jgi:hypothetical protein